MELELVFRTKRFWRYSPSYSRPRRQGESTADVDALRATRAFGRISRRAFAVGIGVALLTGCDLLWLTGPPSRVPRIGHLSVNPLSTNESGWHGFLEGLRENGWVNGQNITTEWRDADGVVERLPGLAAELVGLAVDVIVTGTARCPPHRTCDAQHKRRHHDCSSAT